MKARGRRSASETNPAGQGNTLASMAADVMTGPGEVAFTDDGKNTIASQLVESLREAIISGRLEAGAKINLERTRQTFDVSLSPLREALARLISEGLVLFEDNRGYQVAPLSLGNLEEVTRLREEFESFALRQSMAVGDVDWEAEVMRALHRLNRVERDPVRLDSIDLWERHHRDFHLALISGCRMPLLIGFCRVLLNLNDRYRRALLKNVGDDRDVSAEHSEIAAATVGRDTDLACARLREHLQRTGANLRRHMEGRL